MERLLCLTLQDFEVTEYFYEQGYNVSTAASEYYPFVWGDERPLLKLNKIAFYPMQATHFLGRGKFDSNE